MNLVAIIGSPRKGGNTDLLVDQVIQGVQSQRASVHVEKIYIGDLNLQPCRGDQACRLSGQCIIADDMAEVLEKIRQADALILGAPLYRGYLPGQMKVLMDRTSPFEKDVEVKMDRRGIRLMGLLAAIMPRTLQMALMQRMAGGSGHFYRLDKRLKSVVVVVGAHPTYVPAMKKDLERTAAELGSFSAMSGGKVVSSVFATGVSRKGEVQERQNLLRQAFRAGQQLGAGN